MAVHASTTADMSVFRDPARPLAERLDDLLSRLTLDEKIALLHQSQPAIPRLGIDAFHTGQEALHGLAWLGPATVFPQAIGLASTWNPELVRRVGAAVGDEARGFHHKDPARGGLNVWAPVVNQLRDPRWGRNEEGYAEDPLLTATIATAYAHGLRGEHERLLKTAPTLKHFLAYNNETRRDTTSSNVSPRVLHEYELPPFLAPIAAGAAVAVMASYNLINGRPAHLSPLINSKLRGATAEDLLVVSDAYAPSNVAGAQAYYPDHAASHAALVRAGLDSFTDQDGRSETTVGRLAQALAAGLLTPTDIETAARRLLSIRFRLGEFDPPEANPFAAITEEVINCPAHQELARQAAREAIVLLKNDAGALPLPESVRVAVIGPLADAQYEDWYSGTLPYAVTVRRSVAEHLGESNVEYVEGVDRVTLHALTSDGPRRVVASPEPDGAPLRLASQEGSDAEGTGPDCHFDLFDWGSEAFAIRAAANGRHVTAAQDGTLVNDQPGPNGWVVRETFRILPRAEDEVVLQHIASGKFVVAGEGLVASGDTIAQATGFALTGVTSGVERARAAAAAADLAILVLGNHPLINGRETEDRADLALPVAQEDLVRAVVAANPATVLVVQSSYPYAICWAQEHVPAIVWCAHGGQEFGHALADVLFGDYSPAGRLTQTWYRSSADLPDLLDYDIIANDATYLYFCGDPLYPFGHGLSYTTFRYDDLHCSPDPLSADATLTVTVRVANTGICAGDEVVQLYTRQHTSRVKQPLRVLRGFQRLHLGPGESKVVTFKVRAADLAFWDVTRDRPVVERSRHQVMVGSSSRDIRQVATVRVDGEVIGPRGGSHLAAYACDDYADVTLRDVSQVTGDAVTSTAPGAFVGFAEVNLSGPGRGRARVCATSASRVNLRLNDPLSGPVVGGFDVPAGGRYDWGQADFVTDPPPGVHDLYVVFDAAGISLESVEFTGAIT